MLMCRPTRGGEKLTQHRFSEERIQRGENKPGQTVKRGVNQTSRGLRNCKASETRSWDGGILIDWGMTSLLFITGVKMVLSSLMLWGGRSMRQAEGWGVWMRGKIIMVRWRLAA